MIIFSPAGGALAHAACDCNGGKGPARRKKMLQGSSSHGLSEFMALEHGRVDKWNPASFPAYIMLSCCTIKIVIIR